MCASAYVCAGGGTTRNGIIRGDKEILRAREESNGIQVIKEQRGADFRKRVGEGEGGGN